MRREQDSDSIQHFSLTFCQSQARPTLPPLPAGIGTAGVGAAAPTLTGALQVGSSAAGLGSDEDEGSGVQESEDEGVQESEDEGVQSSEEEEEDQLSEDEDQSSTDELVGSAA